MIKIDSTVNLSFIFPAERPLAYEFYSDMQRVVAHLAYIDLVGTSDDHRYRMYYSTVELGTYHIHVYLDVRMDLSGRDEVLRIIPIKSEPEIKTQVSFKATTTRGYYSSEARFYDLGEETRVEYMFKLRARPPRPKGMRFMPRRMVDKIAQNITDHRVREIAQGFIDSSIDAFPLWLAERAVV